MQPERLYHVVLDVPEPVASSVTAARARFSPLRAEYPVEIGVAGSSGVGPIRSDQDDDRVHALLAEVAAATPRLETRFGPVHRFEGTDLHYLEPTERGPFDVVHRRVVECGIRFYESPHPYTPHCTISGVALTDEERGQLTELKIDDSFVIDTLSVYSEPLPIEHHFSVRLTG